MASLNKVMLMGNLTRDVELRHTAGGLVVGAMGLACNRKWKDKAGAVKEEVTFVDVELFGRTAELAAQYMKKGSGVFVEGRLKLDQWDDKTTGAKRSRLKVVAERMQFVGGKPAAAAPAPAVAKPAPVAAPAGGDLEMEETSVPF